MADVVSPIGRDLIKLGRKLKRLLQQIRNAKNDLSNVIKRTRSVARTYDFFKDTIKVAGGIQELAPMFNRHKQLIESVDEESNRTIERLKRLTGRFRSLIDGKPVNTVQRWIAQFEWSRESKKTVPSLFQDMKVLERSMRTIGTLINIQLLSQTYRRDGSDVVLAQFESLKKMLNIEFDKLRQAQRIQKKLLARQIISPSQHLEASEFAQKIMQILKKEIPQLKNHPAAENQSTSDSSSPPTSPISNKTSPITSPSPSPPSNPGSQTSVINLQEQYEDASSPRRRISRKRRTHSAPSRIPSRSSPHSLSSSDGEPVNHDGRVSGPGMQNQNAGQDQGGTYVQMPPFGPLELVSHTSTRRPSPDRPDSFSSAFDQQRTTNRGGSHPARRRRNSSKISEYGDEGEVTATHKTGSIGLRSGRKGKSRSQVRSDPRTEP